MGDCAKWIKEFPKSNWFKFTSNTKVQFAMDNFHFKQALMNLTTKKNERRLKIMDFVTTENVAIDYTKVSDSKAALLVYDTLMAAAKMKQRKEKKHA